MLPVHSRILFLRHLFPLFAEVASYSAVNKMNPTNLAVCIAASLARSDDMMADAKASSGIRKFLEIGIERIDELAPKLPLRRGGPGTGLPEPSKRRSLAASFAPGAIDYNPQNRQPLVRKRVPVSMSALSISGVNFAAGSSSGLQRKSAPSSPPTVVPGEELEMGSPVSPQLLIPKTQPLQDPTPI